MGNHLIASLALAAPRDYHDVIVKLGEHGIIPRDFAAQIAPMAGFRNILVHEYLAVDLAEVYRILRERLDDFRLFAAHVERFLEENEG